MTLLRVVNAALRRAQPRALGAARAFASAGGDGQDERPRVQVLHHQQPQRYEQAEQDIAALQRAIREAYKCV